MGKLILWGLYAVASTVLGIVLGGYLILALVTTDNAGGIGAIILGAVLAANVLWSLFKVLEVKE
mgnify:FL=1